MSGDLVIMRLFVWWSPFNIIIFFSCKMQPCHYESVNTSLLVGIDLKERFEDGKLWVQGRFRDEWSMKWSVIKKASHYGNKSYKDEKKLKILPLISNSPICRSVMSFCFIVKSPPLALSMNFIHKKVHPSFTTTSFHSCLQLEQYQVFHMTGLH